MERETDQPWGTVPLVIVELAQILAAKAGKSAQHAGRIRWPEKPGDVQDQLRLAIGDAQKVTKAGTDLRALLSAYAHKFHSPRPVISDLARAQETSSQGFIRRYSSETIDAVSSLLSASPDLDLVLRSFASVGLLDLVNLSGPIGVAAKARLRALGDLST